MRLKLLIILLGASCGNASAEKLQVAVAANFHDAFTVIAGNFTKKTGHPVAAVAGSTGKFFLQIRQGAPFDIFIAADAKHPQLLENEGQALRGTRFTYATGKLVLWSPRENFIDRDAKILLEPRYRFVAVANPEVAPYGRAAMQYLRALQIDGRLAGKLVVAQDIGQAYQFISTGNAELGFVAFSQIARPGHRTTGSYYLIPQQFYEPLEQQAIQVKEGKAAAGLMRYLQDAEARSIIRAYGYTIR